MQECIEIESGARQTAQNIFSSGPRLNTGPEGDPRRQAVASLRGYAYQLYASALAWLRLGPDERLYLEVAEDYALTTQEALTVVQVKDTRDAVTVRSKGVREAIEAFVDLTRRNQGSNLQLRFLSTAKIAIERAKEDRAGGGATLTYWRRAAAGADVAPLRAVLDRIELNQETREFLSDCDDEQLRYQFLRKIHWDCGAEDLGGVRQELEATLAAHGHRHQTQMTVRDVRQASALLLEAILDSVLRSERRMLTAFDLQAVLEAVTHQSVSIRKLEAMLGAQSGAEFARASGLRLMDDTPLPMLLAPRRETVDRLAARLRIEGFSFITGTTGIGKTVLARLSANSTGGRWMIADFFGLTSEQTIERLGSLVGDVPSEISGLVLDDLNEFEHPTVLARLAQLRFAFERQDKLCLVTCYRDPSSKVRSELRVSPGSVERTGDLLQPEVAALIEEAGGDATTWCQVVWVAGAFGHPQLVQAIIADLQWRDWPPDELARLSGLDTSGVDVASQRTAARRRLVEAAPENTKAFLYRLSLLFGTFDRSLALAVSEAPTSIAAPGAHLDTLVGPWIDQVGTTQFRISPLLSDAGALVLAPGEQEAVHKSAARHILGKPGLEIQSANAGFVHALLAKEGYYVQRLSLAVITSDQETIGKLSGWLMTLRAWRSDAPIFPDNPTVSRTARLAQVLLEAEADYRPRFVELWGALMNELSEEADVSARESFEHMALAKLLLSPASAALPGWVKMIARFAELSDADSARTEILQRPDMRDEGGVIGFMFLHLAMMAGGVGALEDAFIQLDGLSSAMRLRLLARVHQFPDEAGHFVNGTWAAEHARNAVQPIPSASAFLRMAEMSQRWGEVDIAVRCHVARSIMLEEYCDDQAAGLAALDEAESAVGPHFAISRARAKIAFRRHRHDDALALMREVVLTESLSDPIERAFLCREAAISATEIGENEEALKWFLAAREAANAKPVSSMRPMAIGLAADAALAQWRCGRPDSALVALADAVLELADLEQEDSLKAIYCKKALGHACLWLNGQITDEMFDIDGPIVAPPGFCSNTEPLEQIRSLPLSTIKGSLYLLAIADIRLGGPAGIEDCLDALLSGRHIYGLESMRVRARLDRAIERLNWHDLPVVGPPAIDAALVGVRDLSMRKAEGTALALEDSPFPLADDELKSGQSALAIINDLFLALQITSDLDGSAENPSRLSELENSIVNDGFPRPNFRKDPEARQYAFLQAWDAANTQNCVVEEIFIGGLRMLEWANTSIFGGLLLPRLGDWAVERLLAASLAQRFRLRNPQLTIEMLQVVASADIAKSERLSAVLRAADTGLSLRLDAALRQLFARPTPRG